MRTLSTETLAQINQLYQLAQAGAVSVQLSYWECEDLWDVEIISAAPAERFIARKSGLPMALERTIAFLASRGITLDVPA